MIPTRYCLTLGIAAGALAGAIAAYNYAVDPYLLFDVARVAGFNSVKPAVGTRERMMKAYQVERVSARTILLGSSRVDLGIDPNARAWPASAKPVYNLGLVGTGTSVSLHYLRHHVAMQPGNTPRNLIVGLDFESFLYVPRRRVDAVGSEERIGEVEERLMVRSDGRPNPERTVRVLKDQALGLLSLDAVFDSTRTIIGNRSTGVTNLKLNGQMSEEGFRDTARADGFALLFDQKHLDTVKQYGKTRRVLSDQPDGPIRNLDAIKELLTFAKTHQMHVVLAIQPSHVSRLELLDRLGYWGEFERWKRELTTLVAQASTSQQATLWDFAGYERQAQEAVPVKGSSAGDMKWFWDPVHYNSALGDAMVASIFDPGQQGQFGVALTPANVEDRIVKVRLDREAFRTAMPVETARLAKLACGNYPCPRPLEPVTAAR